MSLLQVVPKAIQYIIFYIGIFIRLGRFIHIPLTMWRNELMSLYRPQMPSHKRVPHNLYTIIRMLKYYIDQDN